MRVALVTHTGQLGGAELATLRLLEVLPRPIEVEAFLGEPGPYADRLRAAGVAVHIVRMDESARSLTRAQTRSPLAAASAGVRLAPALRLLIQALRARRIDVVWSASLKAHLWTAPVRVLTRIPVVWHVHDRVSGDYLPGPVAGAVREVARRVPQAVIANSEATAATLPGAPGLVVARPGLTADQLKPRSGMSERDPNLIGMVGRLSATKGQREVIGLLPTILESHPDVRLRIVGAALFGQQDYEALLRSEVSRLGLVDHVDFVGNVEDPRSEFDRFAMCVHHATVPEPFGQVIAEAMARFTPVVATDGGGATELLHPQGHAPLGSLVPMGDEQEMVRAIREVLDHPDQAAERAERAYTFVADHCRVEETAEIVSSVLERVGAAARGPEVALAHDYLTQRGGAERVVLAMHQAFPSSPVHTLLHEPTTSYPEFQGVQVNASLLNRSRTVRRNFRNSFPLLPFAASGTRVPGAVTIASSSGWAHAFRTSGPKVVYCHSPARWLYQTEAYLGTEPRRSPIGLALLAIGPALRRWDAARMRAADRVLVNSTVVRGSVRRTYGIEAEVLHPPPGLSPDGPMEPIDAAPQAFHLVVSRLLPYKHVEEIIEAFRPLPDRLLVVGSGPLRDQIAADLPPNVTLMSDVSDAQLRWAYVHAQALVAASFEDFGLTPLEAASCGTPTIALRAGGYLDTIEDGVNGAFFDEATPAHIRAAVVLNRDREWDPQRIIATVEPFGQERFAARLREVVEEVGSS